jgi:endonuclease YncB( thermonuclease family)
MTKPWRALVFALLPVFSAISPAFPQQDVAGVASVIDDDTIEIHGQRIRLFGIDAPERGQLCVRPNGERWRCGQQASFALADRIGRAPVRCEPRDIDRYRRVVAVCFKGTEDLDRWMVANGWAVAYRRYSLDYVADEDTARQNRINIWSGEFDMPWDWRRQHQHR